jgi:hypothetical protein
MMCGIERKGEGMRTTKPTTYFYAACAHVYAIARVKQTRDISKTETRMPHYDRASVLRSHALKYSWMDGSHAGALNTSIDIDADINQNQ